MLVLEEFGLPASGFFTFFFFPEQVLFYLTLCQNRQAVSLTSPVPVQDLVQEFRPKRPPATLTHIMVGDAYLVEDLGFEQIQTVTFSLRSYFSCC